MFKKFVNQESAKFLYYGAKGLGLIGLLSAGNAFGNRLSREACSQFMQTMVAQAGNVRDVFSRS